MQDRNSTKPDRSVQANGHILVADDDFVNQAVTRRILEDAGFRVDTVDDGRAVIRAVASSRYDLILMDCFMPGMDGFEATRIIRGPDSTACNPEVPIIALSGLDSQEAENQCREAGMNGLIHKPADPGLLIGGIDAMLPGGLDSTTSAHQANAAKPEEKGATQLGKDEQSDEGFMENLIDRFLAEVPEMVARLEQALAKHKLGELKSLGHRLKGSADVIGSSKLSMKAHALERAATEGDSQAVRATTRELIDALNGIVSATSNPDLAG